MACEVVNYLQVWTRKKYFKKHFAHKIFSQLSQINTRDRTLFSSRYELASGGGEREGRGLGPRNDVLTTCKAVSLRGGQRIIAVFFSQ